MKSNALGILLAYGWAAYPFTLFTLSSNTNDALVAAMVTFALLAITSAPTRGVFAALAGLTKFAPLARHLEIVTAQSHGSSEMKDVPVAAVAAALERLISP